MKPILVHGLSLNYILRTYFTIPMRAVKTDESKGSDSICRISKPRVDIPLRPLHYGDVIMGAIASQIISLMVVYSTVYSDADQRKHHSSASLAFVRGIHHGPVNSLHKWPVTRKVFPFDDVIINGRLSNRGWTSLIKEAMVGTPFVARFQPVDFELYIKVMPIIWKLSGFDSNGHVWHIGEKPGYESSHTCRKFMSVNQEHLRITLYD